MANATVNQVFLFFKSESYNTAQFRKDWAALSADDKEWFKAEVGKTLDAN